MYPEVEYEMSEADFKELIDSMQPVPLIMVGGYEPPSRQDNANRAWQRLGERMGFDHMTVRPIRGKGERFFTARPSETETQRAARVEREQAAAKAAEIERIKAEIAERQARLSELEAPHAP